MNSTQLLGTVKINLPQGPQAGEEAKKTLILFDYGQEGPEPPAFELGKCYQHTSGRQIHICGIALPMAFNTCFVGEEPGGGLTPFGMDQAGATTGWREISKQQFFNDNFSED